MKKLLVLVTCLFVGRAAQADTLIMSVPVPVEFNGSLGPGANRLGSEFHINWGDWITPAQASGATVRLCVSFTDGGVSAETLWLGLLTHTSSGDRYMSLANGFVNTWSGLGLYHQKCTPKAQFVGFGDCGSSWQNSCYVQGGYHAGRLVPFKLRAAWIEIWR
jgi:hypothetical protein